MRRDQFIARKVVTSALLVLASVLGVSALAPQAMAVTTQAVLAPNTANQVVTLPAVTGFASSDVLLVGVSLNGAPVGTSLSFTSTTGLTPAYGYSFTAGMQEISFVGTQASVNATLASALISTGVAEGAFTIHVGAVLNSPNVYYLPSSGSFYEFASGDVSWTSARASAATAVFWGSTGHLSNITSSHENDFISCHVNAQNVWIGASDSAQEGTWIWVDGAESGTQFWQGDSSGSTTQPWNFASWAIGQPSTDNAGNDYGVTNWRGTNGFWNAVPNRPDRTMNGYLVEFAGPFTGVFTDQLTVAVGGGDYAISDVAPPNTACDSGAITPDAVVVTPSTGWLQSYARTKGAECARSWSPSWAVWAVPVSGGSVCNRGVYWSGTQWMQNPDLGWGNFDSALSGPWDGLSAPPG